MEYIVLLGNSDPEIMNKRVKRAVEYFMSSEYKRIVDGERIVTKKIIVSGADAIFPQGILPTDHIIIENKSRNTVEKLTNVQKILDRIHKNKSFGTPKVTICTSSFHVRRSCILANLILSGYTPEFIHTNENIPERLQHHEWNLLLPYLQYFSEISCNTEL